PIAGRAAMQIALRCLPSDEELRASFEQMFGKESRLPAVARRDYTFLSPAPTVTGERRQAWDRALTGSRSARLSDAVRTFEQLTREDEQDAAAWHNLGVARAWLGDNAGAVEALDRFVALETDENRAGEAWALAEVLRVGYGMEAESDYQEYSAVFQVREPQP